MVKRHPTPAAGQAAIAGSLPAPVPRAPALAASPVSGAQCSLVQGSAGEQPAAQCSLLQRAHLVECLFFLISFFPHEHPREQVTCPKLIGFSTVDPTSFCTVTIETSVFCSWADGLKGHEITQRRCLQPRQPLLQLRSQKPVWG